MQEEAEREGQREEAKEKGGRTAQRCIDSI